MLALDELRARTQRYDHGKAEGQAYPEITLGSAGLKIVLTAVGTQASPPGPQICPSNFKPWFWLPRLVGNFEV